MGAPSRTLASVMNRDAIRVLHRVGAVWNNLVVSIQKMYPSTGIRPASADEIFRLDNSAPENEVKFNVNPIVLNVPESVGRRHSLFVAIKGWLSFGNGSLQQMPLRTKSFGTEVGYFRFKPRV